MAVRYFERSKKTSAKDVVDYEISMLEHCATRILEVDHQELDQDELAILEAFLLHFRILLEFFGTPPIGKRCADNLQFQLSHTYSAAPSASALAASKEISKELSVKWEERLNKYLAHPTEKRHTTVRSWPVERGNFKVRVSHL